MVDDFIFRKLKHDHQRFDDILTHFRQELLRNKIETNNFYTGWELLRRHIYIEEELVFPYLSSGKYMMAVFGMLRGHGEIWSVVNSVFTTIDCGGSCQTINDYCEQLTHMLLMHNKIEESVIYPNISNELTSSQLARLSDFLNTGDIPKGWVCSKMS